MGQSEQDRDTQLTKRREQLRISQRAHRNRKRDEENGLKKRVAELENEAQKINEAFLDISKLVLDTNMTQSRPHLASALREVTRKCLSLAEIVQSPSNPSQEALEADSNSSSCAHAKDPVNQPDTEPSKDDTSTSSREDSVPTNHLSILSPPSEIRYGGQISSVIDNCSLPPISPSTTHPIPLLPTASLDEKAEFMHRLVRQCCLAAYQLLVHLPDIPRTREIFGYIPPASSRSQMARSLYNTVLEDDPESLQHKAKALSFLASGDLIPPTISLVPHSTKQAIENFTLDWLDAYGVQKVLSDKGIRLKEDTAASEASRSDSVSSSIQIDVSTFINILVGQAICVGPGPAFRREMVEYALQSATVRR
ncbi:uncharacterized protein N7511_005241 [Penicillium nucicola]|uniref:uncharacterized protein n=1 Tax=Penicillium nucicola TaxID=1850975 RepID=UPI0025454F24|nr:uncharacterized protein N7511_005241 [Penicillium nucicola]KAJ5761859.1 hypothetical protein N7511_005241 [Penicillium nucicola]